MNKYIDSDYRDNRDTHFVDKPRTNHQQNYFQPHFYVNSRGEGALFQYFFFVSHNCDIFFLRHPSGRSFLFQGQQAGIGILGRRIFLAKYAHL